MANAGSGEGGEDTGAVGNGAQQQGEGGDCKNEGGVLVLQARSRRETLLWAKVLQVRGQATEPYATKCPALSKSQVHTVNTVKLAGVGFVVSCHPSALSGRRSAGFFADRAARSKLPYVLDV